MTITTQTDQNTVRATYPNARIESRVPLGYSVVSDGKVLGCACSKVQAWDVAASGVAADTASKTVLAELEAHQIRPAALGCFTPAPQKPWILCT